MKSFFFSMLLVVSAGLYAEDLYVAQSVLGNGDGLSAGNAKAVSFFNTAGNWGAGVGKIGAGDTVHLVGTISTTLTIQGSGSSGSPITIGFESGASLSAPYWDTLPNCAIYANSKNYITIDGNNVGIVQGTANGTALANQHLSHGIAFEGGTDITIRRITVSLYQRTADSGDTTGGTGTGIRGIHTDGVSNLLVEECAINDCKLGLNCNADGSTGTITVRNNTSSRCSTNYQIAMGGNTDFSGLVSFYGNSAANNYYWDAPFENFHSDGLHMFTTGTGRFMQVDIYKNAMVTDYGDHCTGVLFLEGGYGAIRIWSNLLGSTQSKFEGTIDLGSDHASGTSLVLYGNTIVGKASDNTSNPGVYLNDIDGGNWTSVVARNNIFYNFYTAWAIPDNNSTAAYDLDYNGYYNVSNVGTRYTPPSTNQTGSMWDVATFAAYIGGGDEAHAKTADPLFVGSVNYTLQSSSTYKDAGATLASPFNVTILGNTRTGSFDLGAYEFGESVGGDTTPPTPNPSTIFSATATGTSTATVVANTATDITSPPVQYAVSTNNGSSWSAWQASETFNLTGLTAATTYQIKVKARDTATTPNETAPTTTATSLTTASVTISRANPKARALTGGF